MCVSLSIRRQFDLVCSKSLYPTMALSAFNLGGLFGVLIFGYLNDRIGRKMNYFLCLMVEIIGGVATAFAPDIITWSLARFCVGLTIPAILHIPFVMCKYLTFSHTICINEYIFKCIVADQRRGLLS